MNTKCYGYCYRAYDYPRIIIIREGFGEAPQLLKLISFSLNNDIADEPVQATQICAEMSQDSEGKKLKEWNDTWFGSKIELKEAKMDIPFF